MVIEVFTDQAYNLIQLAEDEARMLGQPVVGPEHLLLALARSGNVASLLAQRDVTGTDIHEAIVRAGGLGDQLVLGPVPRSAAAEAALERAVARAAERGILGPSSEHLLLGLLDDVGIEAILQSVGIGDPAALVNGTYPPGRRPPLSAEQVRGYAERARYFEPPRPGPIPPVFERFTKQARAAVMASNRFPDDGQYIEPFHLLLGLLWIQTGVAATVLARHGVALENATAQAERVRPRHRRRALQPVVESRPPHLRLEPELPHLLADATRRLVAEEALRQAYEHGHGTIGTGHLLLAILETDDETVDEALDGKDTAGRVAAAVTSALPGDEPPWRP
jgi:ATP-dependent Clp protease ATP-binding subunit ClpA